MKFYYLILLSLVSSALLAQNTTYITANGCKVRSYIRNSGLIVIWTGKCINGVAGGPGKVQYFIKNSLTNTYKGSLKNGYR